MIKSAGESSNCCISSRVDYIRIVTGQSLSWIEEAGWRDYCSANVYFGNYTLLLPSVTDTCFPGVVYDFEIDVTLSCIELSWRSPAVGSIASAYVVQYDSSTLDLHNRVELEGTELELSDLTSETRVEFSVMARSTCGVLGPPRHASVYSKFELFVDS